jgi:monoamine oxidase
MEKHDVIIVGAGASGIMAAKILSDVKMNVCVLEARDRIGGRIHTFHKPGFLKPVEAGAEYVHGKLPLTLNLLKEAEIKYYRTKGTLWQSKNNQLVKRDDFIEHADVLMEALKKLDEEMTVAQFLSDYFPGKEYEGMKVSLSQYIEGYDAGDINYFSALALKEEWENETEEQYRVEGGYGLLLDHLQKATIKNNVIYNFSTIVNQINWTADHVEVITSGNQIFLAHKVLVTVPLPMLMGNADNTTISFQPDLPEITNAAKSIGYGDVIKIVFEFTCSFWEPAEGGNAKNLLFIFSNQRVPTWWSQLPDKLPRLTGWLAGPNATKLADASEMDIIQLALESLSSIFNVEEETIRSYIKGTFIHNWITDPFCRGGYSFITTTTKAAQEILNTPVADTLFFAGEALGKSSNGTVEAAFESGKLAAEKINSI